LVRLSTGLGGGVAGTRQELCGALSGGLLLIGALHGRDAPGDDDTMAYELSERYSERFRAQFGASQCARLLSTVVKGSGGLGSCGPLVEQAVYILLETLSRATRGGRPD
jgi:C_GCAxxG_C_C family probable redox protein